MRIDNRAGGGTTESGRGNVPMATPFSFRGHCPDWGHDWDGEERVVCGRIDFPECDLRLMWSLFQAARGLPFATPPSGRTRSFVTAVVRGRFCLAVCKVSFTGSDHGCIAYHLLAKAFSAILRSMSSTTPAPTSSKPATQSWAAATPARPNVAIGHTHVRRRLDGRTRQNTTCIASLGVDA
jgi:hypothetical protein